MGQPAYVERVLKKYGMQDARSVSTPVDLGTKLTKFADGDEIFITAFISLLLALCCIC